MNEFFYGSNLDAFFGGIGQGANPISQQPINAFGGWASLNIDITLNTQMNVGAGIDRPNKINLVVGDRSQNIVSFSNLIFTVFENYKIGLEYFLLKTSYVGDRTYQNHRGQFSFIYTF